MSLKSVERESLVKSFFLYFLSLSLLMSLILYKNYDSDTKELDEKLYTQMRLCSFDLKCTQFEFDFIQADKAQTYQFLEGKEGPFALFNIPNEENVFLKLLYPQRAYQSAQYSIMMHHLYNYLLLVFVLALISALFSWYALRPLRQALILSDEFIKDILHDFNTPLASLRLNSALLHKEFAENKKIGRIEQAVQTILDLQNNLRDYIHDSPLQYEQIQLDTLLEERIRYFSDTYSSLGFSQNLEPLFIHANRDAFTRIIDNIISNAVKYNKPNGTIQIILKADTQILCVQDSGKGIKEPKKIFERFYKEHERGLGIGLHIVKKLADSMQIPIRVESTLNVGSTFCLDLKAIAKER